jgi:hypothetical protein
MRRLCSLEDYLRFYERSWKQIRMHANLSDHHLDGVNKLKTFSCFEIIYESLQRQKIQDSMDALDLLRIFSFLHYENVRVDLLLAAMRNPGLERTAAESNDAGAIQTPKPWTGSLRNLGIGIILGAGSRDQSQRVLPGIFRNTNILGSSRDLEIRLRKALILITGMSFLTYKESSDCYSMHPLVHTWVRERPQMTTAEQAVWCEAANTVLAQSILLPPLGLTENHEMLRRDLLPHIDCARKHQKRILQRLDFNSALRPPRPIWPVINRKTTQQQAMMWAKFSFVYAQCGHFNEAEQLQLAFNDFVCEALGVEHPTTLNSMLLLSTTYWQQSRTNDAADLQTKVLEGTLKTFGPDHPRTLKAMRSLGASLCSQGRLRRV